jgi:hypothetical protein
MGGGVREGAPLGKYDARLDGVQGGGGCWGGGVCRSNKGITYSPLQFVILIQFLYTAQEYTVLLTLNIIFLVYSPGMYNIW